MSKLADMQIMGSAQTYKINFGGWAQQSVFYQAPAICGLPQPPINDSDEL